MPMQSELRLAVITGGAGEGRFGDLIADWLLEEVRRSKLFRIDHVDLRELELPWARPSDEAAAPEATAALLARLRQADAFLVVTPEYNHGYPAPLKHAIDLGYAEWHAKPVAFVSYGGMSGGLRAVEQLRQVFVELHAVTVRDGVSFHRVEEQFDAHGAVRDAAAVGAAAASPDLAARVPQPGVRFSVLGATWTGYQVFLAAAVAALLLGTWLFLKLTPIGKRLRAVSQNRQGALVVGLDPFRVELIAFALAGALAGAAGTLASGVNAFDPSIAAIVVIKAFAIVIFAGMGSVPGAIVGALIVGLAETLTGGLISTQYAELTAFVLMIVVLFFLLKDGWKIVNFTLRWFHGTTRAQLAESVDRCSEVLGGYVRGSHYHAGGTR